METIIITLLLALFSGGTEVETNDNRTDWQFRSQTQQQTQRCGSCHVGSNSKLSAYHGQAENQVLKP